MANDISKVLPKILAMGLLALREQAIMPRLVNNGYSTYAAQKGSTIDIPIPSAIAVNAVSPSYIPPPNTQDIAPTSVSIVMDQWYESPFYLTDKDRMEAMEGTVPMQVSEAIRALANNVDTYILSFYKGIYGYVGTAGTTPFASDTSLITGARTVLTRQLCPVDNRRFILDPAAEGNALGLSAFQYVNQGGDTSVMREGNLGRRLGFDFGMDQNIPTHTAGSITTGLTAKATTAQAAGLTSVVCTTAASTGAMSLKKGDIVLFAGDLQTYVIGADIAQASAATDVTITIQPPLKVAIASSGSPPAVTVKASHVVNLAFHRDAFAFASRPLEQVDDGLGHFSSAIDPISGLSLRLEVTREHKRNRWSFDMLYGGQIVRPALACRVAG